MNFSLSWIVDIFHILLHSFWQMFGALATKIVVIQHYKFLVLLDVQLFCDHETFWGYLIADLDPLGRWWDPITPSPRNPLSYRLFSVKCHYSDAFHAHPLSIMYITLSPTTHLSPTATPRQGTGLRPLLFRTHYYFELSEHWVFHCAVHIISLDFYLY